MICIVRVCKMYYKHVDLQTLLTTFELLTVLINVLFVALKAFEKIAYFEEGSVCKE